MANNNTRGEMSGTGDNNGGAGPFGIGGTPGVFQGESAGGSPTILGPQYPQQYKARGGGQRTKKKAKHLDITFIKLP